MGQENKQKIKLLLVMEILRRETDEAHPITTPVMCKRLQSMGISCDRRTLYQDMELLNEYGFPVEKRYIGHALGYYLPQKRMTEAEFRFVTDAVKATGFLMEPQVKEITEKMGCLGALAGLSLPENSVTVSGASSSGEDVFAVVETVSRAMDEGKRITFKYFDLDEKHEKVYRKAGRRYHMDPAALIYSEDNYYLLTFNPKHDAHTTFRVDRMCEVELSAEPVSEKCNELRRNADSFASQVFKMYSGEPADVTLRFPNELMGPVFDKFGAGVNVFRLSDNLLEAEVSVQLSPVFYGWVFQFGGQMRILGPKKAVKEYRSAVLKAFEAIQ